MWTAPPTNETRAVTTVALFLACGCAMLGWRAPPNGEPVLRGNLRLVGSRTLSPAVARWTDMMTRANPHVNMRAAMYGSGLAAGALAERKADIAPLSRALLNSERRLLGDTPTPAVIQVGWRGAAHQRDTVPKPVYLYLARQPDGAVDPAAQAFARIAVSNEGQARLRGLALRPLNGDERRISAAAVAALARRQDMN